MLDPVGFAEDQEPSTIALQEAAIANTACAILAVARRDLAGATARIGETASFAEQLLKAPDVRANALGEKMLRELVVEPLAVLAKAGATAVIQPGGSVRDAEVIAAADEQGIAMVFTGFRHFRH